MNKNGIIATVEKEYLRKKRMAAFNPGDVIKVHLKIKEGDKERIQIFEGVVIARKGEGARETFKVRRIASGVGVERTFNLHSPLIEEVQVTKRGDVGRAKLYYLRGKTGRHAKIKQMGREKMLALAEEERKAIEAEQAASALAAAAEAEAQAAQAAKEKAEKTASA